MSDEQQPPDHNPDEELTQPLPTPPYAPVQGPYAPPPQPASEPIPRTTPEPQPTPEPAPYTLAEPQQPTPQPMPQPTAQPARRRASLPLGTWLGVAAMALVLGLVGGLSGAALMTALDDANPGRMRAGLDGARTQDTAPLDADNGSVAAVAQALLPSTVQILASFRENQAGATGSGFYLDRDGHIVTNNHVVAGAADTSGRIVVIDHDGTRLDATIVGRSPVYDLAVLKVDAEDDVEAAALGSRELLVGEEVVALGAPLGLSQTVTAGIVSALDRPVTTSGQEEDDASFINAVQTDAAINPGNSGGPLVNLAGEVVGVNSAIATTGGSFGGESGNIGVGFAIPIAQVKTTVDQILRTGEAQYPVIGATVQTRGPDGPVTGAQITEVFEGSPADQAGLRASDIVTEINEQRVADGIALIVAIRTYVPGEEVELTVERDGKERTLVVELGGEVG